MSDKQYSSAEVRSSAGHPLESDIRSVNPHKTSSEVLGFGLYYAKPAKEVTSKVELPPFVQNRLPFVTYARKLPDFDVASSVSELSGRSSLHKSSYGMNNLVNELSSCRRDQDISIQNNKLSSETKGDAHQEIKHLMEHLQNLNKNLPRRSESTHFGSEFSSSNERDAGIGHLSTSTYGNKCISNVLPHKRDKVIRVDEEYLSFRRDQNIHLSENILNERVVDIASQLLAVSEVNNPPTENSEFKSYVSLNDISLDYWQLYAKSPPENYDFAMNIMAYIEFLNDSSWKATVSYFDENVKKMVESIWNEKRFGFNSAINLQGLNRTVILKLMVDFTQWSVNRNFELSEFLNYCVLMCQLGAIARKYNFKEAPLYAICQLRERMKLLKFENFVQFMFEIVVKEYAQRLNEYSMM